MASRARKKERGKQMKSLIKQRGYWERDDKNLKYLGAIAAMMISVTTIVGWEFAKWSWPYIRSILLAALQ